MTLRFYRRKSLGNGFWVGLSKSGRASGAAGALLRRAWLGDPHCATLSTHSRLRRAVGTRAVEAAIRRFGSFVDAEGCRHFERRSASEVTSWTTSLSGPPLRR